MIILRIITIIVYNNCLGKADTDSIALRLTTIQAAKKVPVVTHFYFHN